MCGIIGIVSNRETNIAKILKESLSWLTYRGYDSFGYAIKVKNGLDIKKSKGRIENFKANIDVKGKIGIGHTRWATHGAPTRENAHPHLDCSENIAVVHNGVIKNYAEIKEKLISKGHYLKSKTDTEVIPHLIEDKLENYKDSANPFLLAFRDTVKELKGTYAIAAIWSRDERIYAARKTNPLLIGVGQDVHFVSSDIPAFLKYTNKFVPLEDDQIAIVSSNKYELYDIKLGRIIPKERICPFNIEEISKGNYEHFMLKEIQEQDEVLKRILSNRNAIVRVAEKLRESFKKVRKIYFVGCGSSFHACVAGKYMFERLLGIPSEAILSSEFKTIVRDIPLNDSFVIFLSQSGETFDTYTALEEFLSFVKEPKFLIIVNNPYSSIERLAKNKFGEKTQILHLSANPEICVVATKTYTAQLYLIALLTLQRILPKERKMEIKNFFKEARKTPEKVGRILKDTKKVEALAGKYKRYERFFVIGRNINLATGLEAALKLKEVCYVSAEGIAGGELKHGSLAAVDEHSPVIILFPPSQDSLIWDSTFTNFMEVQARGAPIISVCCESDKKGVVEKLSEDILTIPDTEWLFSPILQIIPLQLLAYNMAIKKGINPDYPRNLAKTVTVE